MKLYQTVYHDHPMYLGIRSAANKVHGQTLRIHQDHNPTVHAPREPTSPGWLSDVPHDTDGSYQMVKVWTVKQ